MYNKTVWKTGDIIPADKMNNIENGIGANDIAITDIKKELTKTVKTSEKGVANGIATLDENGKVSSEQLPESQTGDFIPNSEKGVTVATLEDGELVGTQVPNNIKSHIVNEENPHNVTADQIGLTPIDGLSGSNVQAVLQAISLLLKSSDVDISNLERLFTADGASLVGLQPVSGVSGGNLQQVIISLADTISKIDSYFGQPVAISQGGTGAKTSQEALYNLGAKPNKNLLDNPSFEINQRNITSWTGGYGVDRWLNTENKDTATISISNNVITLTSTVADVNELGCVFSQFLENDTVKAGQTVTLSFLGENKSGNLFLNLSNDTKKDYTYRKEIAISQYGLHSYTMQIPKTWENGDKLRFSIFQTGAGEATISHSKLELGENQTLARQPEDGHWELLEKPDYADELAKCQRYQLVLNGYSFLGVGVVQIDKNVQFAVPIPVAMRLSSPTIEITNAKFFDGSNIYSGTIQPLSATTNTSSVKLNALFSEAPNSASGWVYLDIGQQLILDANL